MMDIRYKKLNEIAIRERYRQSMPLFEALSLNEIPFVVHKGAPLSRLIYGNPFHRISGDIDLLIPREHIDETIQTFVANGFRQGAGADFSHGTHTSDNAILQRYSQSTMSVCMP